MGGHTAIVFALCTLKLAVDFPKVCRKLSFADWLSVDANPLSNLHQMWRTDYRKSVFKLLQVRVQQIKF